MNRWMVCEAFTFQAGCIGKQSGRRRLTVAELQGTTADVTSLKEILEKLWLEETVADKPPEFNL